MTSIEAKRLAQRIARIEREQANQGKPQLAYSSIENGNLKSYEGNDLKMVVGLQDDGGQATTVFNGPTPPTPANYTVTVDHGSLTVHWDGDFENDVVAPSDWARWTAYAQEGATVTPSRASAIGGTDSASGGEVTAGVLKGQWTVTVLAWSQAGKPSAMGLPVTVDVPGYGDIVLAEIDAAETLIKNAGEILVTEQGTLDEKLSEVDGSLNDLGQDLQAVEDAQAQLNTDLTDVMTSIDGKNTITWNPAAPTSATPGKAVGDMWYRTSGNNIIGFWKWDGTDWVTQLLDVTTIPLIDIGAGTFGTLRGARLEANSVSVDKLIVSPNANLISDSSFQAEGAGWNGLNGGPVASDTTFASVSDGPSGVGANVARVEPSWNDLTAMTSKSWPRWVSVSGADRLRGTEVVPGDSFRLVLRARWVKRPNSGVGHVRIRGGFNLNGNNNQWPIITGNISSDGTLSEWRETTGIWAHPGESELRNRLSISVHVSGGVGGIVEVSSVGMYAMTGTTTIQDGAISTHKLAADVLEVKNLKATTGQLDEAVISKLFSDVVVAKMAVADEFIGENAILTGAITASKITASEELWAKIGEFVKIRAEQIESDAIDGMVITGPTIQSARTGQRWVGDASGIRIFNADNEVRTQLSPDDSVFKGEVEADTLVVNGGAEFKANNTLAQGGSLLLAAGVTDPTAPPTVQPFWDGLEFDNPTGVTGKVGLAFDGTNYWTANPDGLSSAFNFVRINATTGASTAFSSPVGPAGGEWFGVTCIGTELFWFYQKRYQAFVLVTDLSLVKKREWEYPGLAYTSSNPLTYKPGIGNDGTNIVIAQCDDNGPLNIRTYNKTTGALISAVKDTGDGTKSDITGVYVGNADWGRKLVTVAKRSGGKLPSFSATTGVYDGGATQFNAATLDSTGVVFVDGKFRTLDPSGMIHEYADVTTGDNSSDWWAAYRWYTDVNDDDIIGATDYTSRISPGARFTWPSRAMVRVIGQPLPDGAGALGPYLAKKSAVPVRTDYHAPSWWPTVGRPVAEWRELSTDWGTKPVPGDTNTYPEGTSSVLESASGTFRVQGDGSGYWGPLKMGRNGVMSGLVVSGSAFIKPDQADQPKTVTVTLPAGRFAKPPVVWAQATTTIPHLVHVGVTAPTASSFELTLVRYNTTSTGVFWYAMDSE